MAIMSIRDFFQIAGEHPLALVAVFVALPLAAWLTGLLHGGGGGGAAPWKHLDAILVYLACVPGMFAAVIISIYSFFSHENLLDANLLVHFLPIVSMVVTLIFIRKNVPFDAVPGFDRLSGLMVMVGCSFAVALAIQKTNIWLFFGGSIEKLFLLAGGVFALSKWGTYTLFRRQDEPKKEPPKFPGV